MAKRWFLLAALTLFGTLPLAQSQAVQDGFWKMSKGGEFRFIAINPQGDTFVYLVRGDPTWIPKVDNEELRDEEQEWVSAEDLEISDVRYEGETLVGHVVGITEEGEILEGERSLETILLPDYTTDGWISADVTYLEMTGGQFL